MNWKAIFRIRKHFDRRPYKPSRLNWKWNWELNPWYEKTSYFISLPKGRIRFYSRNDELTEEGLSKAFFQVWEKCV